MTRVLLFFFLVPFGMLSTHALKAESEPFSRVARPLDHRLAEDWKRIAAVRVSEDGAWIAWVQSPYDGDPELFVSSWDGTKLYRRNCGTNPRFTKDGKRVLFTLAVSKQAQRAKKLAELEKRRKRESAKQKPKPAQKTGGKPKPVKKPQLKKQPAKQPKAKPKSKAKQAKAKPPALESALGILELESGKIRVIAGARSWRYSDAVPEVLLVQRKDGGSSKLIRYDLDSKKVTGSWADTKGLVLRAGDTRFFFLQPYRAAKAAKKGSKEKPVTERAGGLRVADLRGGEARLLHGSRGEFRGPYLDKKLRRVVWMHQGRKGDESVREKRELPRRKTWELWYWAGTKEDTPHELLKETRALAAGGKALLLTPDRRPSFSRDGSTLFVGVRERPPLPLPSGLSEDEVKLDIWHWKDRRLQPWQARSRASYARRSIPALYHFGDQSWRVIGTRPLATGAFLTPDGGQIWWIDREPYAALKSWDTNYQDVYVADTGSGRIRRVLTKVLTKVRPSLDGRYLLELGRDHQWYAHDILEDRSVCLTEGLGLSFVDERWDRPLYPPEYGILGWAKDDAYVYLYDRYDLWRMAPDGSERLCLTGGYGRDKQLRFRRMRLDPEEKAVDPGAKMLLSAFDERSMASGFYRFDPGAEGDGLQKLTLKHAAFGRQVYTGKDQKKLYFTVSRFDLAPDLWSCDPEFENMRRLSDSNPQQKNYRWGKAELVHWTGLSGQKLKGILIKPDGFDPKRKYPLMVYFYARRSETLHQYRLPHPGTNPSPSFYVSRGYLWFIPDVHYQTGRPGQSALDCVVPGVLSLLKKGYIDAKRVGMAGHSWGGYQVSYLVTRTKLFAAAEAGAPVSNMTSAYGGMRWGTGLSRMFQYEVGQSRIGGSLWEKPRHYLENSPIFRADEIETPLLILHNDKDGAVPWSQGLEFFMALRRLQKEAYLFNYNGEAHGLRKKATQRDWARRMQEFFDHHLLGKRAPKWMQEGVPYRQRMQEKYERQRSGEAGQKGGRD